MISAPRRSLLHFLSQVPDPRGRQGLRHNFPAMLATTVCAVLCGARSYAAIVQWLHLQSEQTWRLLGFWRTPPKSTCFESLLPRVCGVAFAEALRAWVQDGLQLSLNGELAATALDGKTLRGSFNQHEKAVHLLAALDHKLGCVLSQMPVDGKTNEHKTAMELLENLVLKGRVITGDAMFCQRDVCQKIRDGGGHYLVVVKDNQPTLRQHIASAFVETEAFSPLRPAGVPKGT